MSLKPRIERLEQVKRRQSTPVLLWLNAIGKATAARTRQRKAGESGRHAVALHFMNGITQELYQAA